MVGTPLCYIANRHASRMSELASRMSELASRMRQHAGFCAFDRAWNRASNRTVNKHYGLKGSGVAPVLLSDINLSRKLCSPRFSRPATAISDFDMAVAICLSD